MNYKREILTILLIISGFFAIQAQINTNKVLAIGRNALYFEDYVLSIQYFNQVIRSKPYLAEPYLYRALAKLNLDDYQGAEEDLTKSIEINPFIVYSYLYRGIARQYQSNFSGAIEDYNKGLEFRPDDKQLLMNKGIAYVQDKKYDSAIAALSLLINSQPKYAVAYTTRGSIYAEKGDTVQAYNDFNKSLELDKYFAPTYAQRGMLYFQQVQYKEALADYNEAIRLDPKQVGYYVNRGLIRYNLNDLRGAMADYNAVITLDSRNTIGRFNRGLLLEQVGDVSGAVEDFNVVIGNEPDNFMAIYNLAILNNELHNYQKAVANLDQVLNEYPYFVPGYYFRAEVKRAMKDAVGADKDYWYAYDLEQKLKKEKASGKTITGKGIYSPSDSTALAKNGTGTNEKTTRERSDKNIEKFNRLVMYDKEEETKSSYKDEIRGRVQDRQIKVDLAPQFVITYYEKPENIDKTVSRFDKTIADYNARMMLKMQLKLVNREAALSDQQVEFHFHSIDDFSLAIEKNPNDADAYFGRALDFMVLQDLTEALKDFSKVIDLQPNFILAYFNRAVVRSKLLQIDNSDENAARNEGQNLNIQVKPNKSTQTISGSNPYIRQTTSEDNSLSNKDNNQVFNYDQIIQDYTKVIQLNPDFVYAYYNLANMRAYQRNYREAVADYTEAINRNPDFAEAYFNRGLTRLSLGDAEKGIADLSKAGELGIIEAYSIIKKMSGDNSNSNSNSNSN